jgi:hypothetical protein
MAVISALGTAAKAVRRNPILFVVVGLYGILQVPQILAQAVHPLLSSVVSLAMLPVMVLVVPFFFAGIVAMAADAIDGTTGVDTLIASGKRHYVSVLVAYLLLVAVNVVLLFAGVVAFVIGGVFVLGQGAPETATLVGFGLVVAILVLIYLVVAFFLQFFAHAIIPVERVEATTAVLEDLGAIDGLERSVQVVRDNLLATFGYTLILAVLGSVVGGLAGILSMIASLGARSGADVGMGPGTGFGSGTGMEAGTGVSAALPEVGLVSALLALLGYLLITAILGGFFATYSTAFYREIRGSA